MPSGSIEVPIDSGEATVTLVEANLVGSFTEVAVMLTIRAAWLGFGFGAVYETC